MIKNSLIWQISHFIFFLEVDMYDKDTDEGRKARSERESLYHHYNSLTSTNSSYSVVKHKMNV